MNRRTSKTGPRRTSRSGRSRSTARRRSGASGRRKSASNRSASGWSRHGTALPSWADLEPSQDQRHQDDDSFFERVSTVRFALLLILFAGAFTLYVGHVHATKNLLGEVQEARAENQRLHLKHNRLQGEFARKTSSSVIYERARELGLRASETYGPPISIDE